MKSLSAYSVTMLAPLSRKRNAEKNERSDFSDNCVVVVYRRLYPALALGHAPKLLACVTGTSNRFVTERILLLHPMYDKEYYA